MATRIPPMHQRSRNRSRRARPNAIEATKATNASQEQKSAMSSARGVGRSRTVVIVSSRPFPLDAANGTCTLDSDRFGAKARPRADGWSRCTQRGALRDTGAARSAPSRKRASPSGESCMATLCRKSAAPWPRGSRNVFAPADASRANVSVLFPSSNGGSEVVRVHGGSNVTRAAPPSFITRITSRRRGQRISTSAGAFATVVSRAGSRSPISRSSSSSGISTRSDPAHCSSALIVASSTSPERRRSFSRDTSSASSARARVACGGGGVSTISGSAIGVRPIRIFRRRNHPRRFNSIENLPSCFPPSSSLTPSPFTY